MDWRRRVLPIAIHPQHDFAADGFRLVGQDRVSLWELRAYNRANFAGVDQLSDLFQFFPPRLDDEERFSGAFVLRILLGRGDRQPWAMAWARPRNGATQDRRGRVDGWRSWELLVSDLDKDLCILPIHAR